MVTVMLSEKVEDEDLSKYGKLLKNEEGEGTIEIDREATATVVAGMLQTLPVSDVRIEEPSTEEIVRQLFTEKPAEAATPT